MIARLLHIRRQTVATVLGMTLLGGFFALLAVEAFASIGDLFGMTFLHDVGRNTGPLAVAGGAGAGVGAAAGGRPWQDPTDTGQPPLPDFDPEQDARWQAEFAKLREHAETDPHEKLAQRLMEPDWRTSFGTNAGVTR